MKYPFISLRPIIAEVMGDLKKLSATTAYIEDDAYTWAVDAARQIGGNNYESEISFINIEKYNGCLPKNFYMINDVKVCALSSIQPTVETPVTPGPKLKTWWIPTTLMRPADTVTWKFCSRDCLSATNNRVEQAYTIKCPPGVIRVSFPTGKLFLNYLKIPTDAEGIVLIQDEINAILATKNYIKMMMLQEPFLMGEVNANAFFYIKNEWEDYLRLAQQKQTLEGFVDTAFKAVEQDQRYRRFNPRQW